VGNSAAPITSAQFTTDAATPDPAVLSLPTAAAAGATGATGTVTTDLAGGTLYWIATANASELAAVILAGFSQPVTASGLQNVGVTGLNPASDYFIHYLHVNGGGNSNIVSSDEFTTAAFGGGAGGLRGTHGLSLSIGLSL